MEALEDLSTEGQRRGPVHGLRGDPDVPEGGGHVVGHLDGRREHQGAAAGGVLLVGRHDVLRRVGLEQDVFHLGRDEVAGLGVQVLEVHLELDLDGTQIR